MGLLFSKSSMAPLSARQYDAHYRRLGLRPGASVDDVEAAAAELCARLEPERLNAGPLRDVAPFRITEIRDSAQLIKDYWQLHSAAPPSIQGQHIALLANGDETEIRNMELLNRQKPLGPEEPRFNLSYSLFKFVDGPVSPHTDLLKPRSIIGLLILGIIWIWLPQFIARLLSLMFRDLGIDTWLAYFTVLAQILPICFAPPLVMYEYAFFRQLQFPFFGTLRLPFRTALDKCLSRLTTSSGEIFAGWSIEDKVVEIDESGYQTADIVAVYSGISGEAKLPLRLHLHLERLNSGSTLLVYWFRLNWQVLFKGRVVSRMKSARFELDRLIKEN